MKLSSDANKSDKDRTRSGESHSIVSTGRRFLSSALGDINPRFAVIFEEISPSGGLIVGGTSFLESSENVTCLVEKHRKGSHAVCLFSRPYRFENKYPVS